MDNFTQKRAELLSHIQNTASQYNLEPLGRKIAYKANRKGVAEHFPDPAVRKSMETNLALLDHYDQILNDVELHIARTAKTHNADSFYRLRSVPGIRKAKAITLLAHKLGRAVYYMLKRREAFDLKKFAAAC